MVPSWLYAYTLLEATSMNKFWYFIDLFCSWQGGEIRSRAHPLLSNLLQRKNDLLKGIEHISNSILEQRNMVISQIFAELT